MYSPSNESPVSTLDKLFPAPSPPPSRISPVTWPGTAPQSVEVLQEVLKDNHTKWHIFFNEKRFHNHAAHRALAIYALGGAGPVIRAGYEKDCHYERKLFKSPGEITHENFREHLGDERYYDSYLRFFTEIVLKHGTAASLEHYIFSRHANISSSGDQPQMLNRFLSGLLHPLIHTGYGVEFGLPGMVVEGLAQAAIHLPGINPLIPAGSFDITTEVIDTAISRFASVLALSPFSATVLPAGTHAFTIVARILKDKRFDDMKPGRDLGGVLQKHGELIREYVSHWTINTADPKQVEVKLGELCWTNVLIYGLGGWSEGKEFKSDFFLMHLVTSSLFLSSLLAYLSPSSQSLLLRSYFATSLAWWLVRGRPQLNIHGFYSHKDKNSDISYPKPPGVLPDPTDGALPSPSSSYAINPNPWLPIVETTVIHPDDHIAKLQRSLAHYSQLYGQRRAGMPDFEGTELPDADKLDGSFFLRVSGLTMNKMGWVRNGQKPANFWDTDNHEEDIRGGNNVEHRKGESESKL